MGLHGQQGQEQMLREVLNNVASPSRLPSYVFCQLRWAINYHKPALVLLQKQNQTGIHLFTFCALRVKQLDTEKRPNSNQKISPCHQHPKYEDKSWPLVLDVGKSK